MSKDVQSKPVKNTHLMRGGESGSENVVEGEYRKI